jgi:hypothetical protein
LKKEPKTFHALRSAVPAIPRPTGKSLLPLFLRKEDPVFLKDLTIRNNRPDKPPTALARARRITRGT